MKEYMKPMLEMIMMEEDAIRTSSGGLQVGGTGTNDQPVEWLKL